MDVTEPGITWTFIAISWLTTIAVLFLAFSLLNSFLRKKTAGTILLFSSYFLIGIGAVGGALAYTLEIFGYDYVAQVLQALATIVPLVAILLIYVFSCRHILKDNEIVKSIHLIIFSGLIGFVLTVYFLAFNGVTPTTNENAWYFIDSNNPTADITNYSSRILSIIILFIQIYITVRIIIRAFILSRRTDKLIRKRGLLMIAWGLVIYVVGGAIIGLEFQINIPAVILTFWTIRKLVFLVSYVFLYLGWVMPDWFRRNIRDKTWFEMRYKEVGKFVQ